MAGRDDFPPSLKNILAARAGYRCSNPTCRAATSGPQLDEAKAINLGVAAHITAASPGGPRYDSALSGEDRSDLSNAVWLCQNCAKLVDNDTARYSVQLLNNWRRTAEKNALRAVGRTRTAREEPTDGPPEAAVRRRLKLRDALRRALLRPPGATPPARAPHPYGKFRVHNLIVRSLDDTAYPQNDDSPGISSWFRVEPFDFYHNGIEVILNLRKGAINREGRWRLLDDRARVEDGPFREIKVWVIGQIPFHFIRAYDLEGDEYYNEPHLYCLYGNNGEPYEAVRYALCTEGPLYDRPLDPAQRIE